MGGKRTDAISPRDLEVLEFVARYGVVPRRAVASWAETRRAATLKRERRLRLAELLRVLPAVGDSGCLLLATRDGLRAVGRSDLRPAQLSLARVRHEAVVADLAARLEREGDRLLSEREIVARERAEGERILSAALPNGRFHRADLLRLDPSGSPPEAIEVELTPKGATRLDEIIRAWRRAVVQGRLSRVLYLCSPTTRRYVNRAVERTRTIHVAVKLL